MTTPDNAVPMDDVVTHIDMVRWYATLAEMLGRKRKITDSDVELAESFAAMVKSLRDNES